MSSSDMHEDHDKPVHYWKEDGEWCCAVPKPDPFAASNIPGRGEDWWKRFGLKGRGKNQAAALEDLRSWQRCSKLVSDIY